MSGAGPRLVVAAAALLAGCREPEAAERAAPPAAVTAVLPAPDPRAELAGVGGEIAFVSEPAGRAEIHAVLPDGSGRRVVARAPDVDFFPVVGEEGALLAIRTTGGESPAHREELVTVGRDRIGAALHAAGRIRNPSPGPGWIAFESDHRSFRDIHRVGLDGGPVRRLTDSRHGNFEPAVSPDGKSIAFASSRDGNAEIYIMSADGAKETRLTAFHRDDWSPRWSPSGDAIAFLSAREGTGRVFLMRPDGTGQARLLASWDEEIEEETPAWSPDGTRIALVARRTDGTSEVWVADRAGKRWPISEDRGRDTTPAWSPDGRFLVFASKTGHGSHLSVARADGGGTPVPITTGAIDWLPRWIARR